MISLVELTAQAIRFKTSMKRSDLYDYSRAYIVFKGTITDIGAGNRDRTNKDLV